MALKPLVHSGGYKVRVPTVESPSAQREVPPGIIPNEEFTTQAPIEAFGGGPEAEAANRAVRGVTEEASGLMEKLRKNADEVRVNDLTLKAANYKDQLLATAKQAEGDKALSQIQPTQDAYEKYVADLNKNVNGEYQSQLFNNRSTELKNSLQSELQSHAGEALKQKQKEDYGALVDIYQNQYAKAQTDADRNLAKKNMDDLTEKTMSGVYGYGPDHEITQKQKLDNFSTALGTRVMLEARNGNSDLAYKIIDDNPDAINEKRMPQLLQHVQEVDVVNTALRDSASLKQYQYGDGTYNFAAIEADGRNVQKDNPHWTDEMRDKWVGKMIEYARNQRLVSDTNKKETFDTYFNHFQQAHDKGISYADAQKLNTTLGTKFNTDERALGSKVLDYIYNRDLNINPSNIKNFNGLIESMGNKDFSYKNITDELTNGDITLQQANDAGRYWAKYVNGPNSAGLNPAIKQAKDSAMSLAKRQTKDPDELEEFNQMLNQHSVDMNPTELLDYAKKSLDSADWKGTFNFEKDYENYKLDKDKWDTYNKDIGDDVVNKIVDSKSLEQGKIYSQVSPLDVYDFGNKIKCDDASVSGTGRIKSGTIGNAAIKYFMKTRPGQTLDAEKINKIIDNARAYGIDLNAQ